MSNICPTCIASLHPPAKTANLRALFYRNINPMTHAPPPSRPRNAIASIIFASRWLQLPIYLGLIVVQLIYAYKFMKGLWHLLTEMDTLADSAIMLAVLNLIDVVMIANLLLMVIIGGYETWWCPKMYAASNKSVVDIEKSDGKCLNVIEHLLGKTAGFTHRTAYPLA